jgi:hypothetical protein
MHRDDVACRYYLHGISASTLVTGVNMGLVFEGMTNEETTILRVSDVYIKAALPWLPSRHIPSASYSSPTFCCLSRNVWELSTNLLGFELSTSEGTRDDVYSE